MPRRSARLAAAAGGNDAASSQDSSPAAAAVPPQRPIRVAFLHPNLGIGGAERLIVDAACALQQPSGEDGADSSSLPSFHTTLFTNYHDRSHCYTETRDGTLTVRVYGRTFSSILGRARALVAYAKMLYLALVFALLWAREFDVVVVDQVAHAVPMLRLLTRCKILFYCHYPDCLLSQPRSLLHRLYRLPLDAAEEWSTGLAHVLLVNSRFTLSMLRSAFPRLARRIDSCRTSVHVLYPSIDFERYRSLSVADVDSMPEEQRGEVALLREVMYASSERQPKLHMFVSINRFERKKRINTAIDAYAAWHRAHAADRPSTAPPVRLMLCGGYDPANDENRAHYAELWAQCERLGLRPIELRNERGAGGSVQLRFGAGWRESTEEEEKQSHRAPPVVFFLRSFSDLQRSWLLTNALGVLYTPPREHFGIVPVEAMYARSPVLAHRSGGPVETVRDCSEQGDKDATGFLCGDDSEEWTAAMQRLVQSQDRDPVGQTMRDKLGSNGREHVLREFHFRTFQAQLKQHILGMIGSKQRLKQRDE